jgi:spore coat polysaccharide biosynthesis protein SpsF
MKLGIIIQARTGSTRLPNKMILPFYQNHGILEIIIQRIKLAKLNIPIILATTLNPNDNQIEELALKNEIIVFRGSENNVLDRFINAANLHKIDKIIRVCADNPFLDMFALKNQIDAFQNTDDDYWCYCKSDFTPTIKTHYGFWTEGVTLSALKKVASLTNEKLFSEHVTNYIYSTPNEFKIHFETINSNIEKELNIRLTIDTVNDFEIAKEIFNAIINKVPFEAEQIITFVKQNPKWVDVMKNEITNNIK